MNKNQHVQIYESVAVLEAALGELLRQTAQESIGARGKFTLGVSGINLRF